MPWDRLVRSSLSGLLALALLASPGLAHAQEAPQAAPAVTGTTSVVEVSGRGGVPVADRRVTVRLPADDPEVELVFTERGATLVSARMLGERYWADPLEPIDGVPADKLAGGALDLISTWSPVFLPFRLVFNQLDAAGQEASVVVRRARGAVIVAGRIAAPDRANNAPEVDRPVRVGDTVVIRAPAQVAGEFEVERVESTGALDLRQKLAAQDVEGLDYEVRRSGPLAKLWETDSTFAQVSEGGSFPVVYVWPDPRTDSSPVFVEKRFTVGQHPNELNLEVRLHNVSPSSAKAQIGLSVSGWQHPGGIESGMFSRPMNLYNGSCYTADSLERHEYTSLYEEHESFQTHTDWVGVDTQYFLVAAVATDLQGGQCRLHALPPPTGVTMATLWAPSLQTIKPGDRGCTPEWLAPRAAGPPSCDDAVKALGHAPGDPLKKVRASWQSKREDVEGAEKQALDDAWASLKGRERAIYKFKLFVGPKDSARLKATGHALDSSLDFGILAFIAEPLLAFLKWLQSVLGHWGAAIAVLTITLKSLLLPLTNKSFSQMQRMAQLRPKLDALKEQHGEDREAFAKAQMALFKREKVNPLGGCFPMLIQMPIWFALYQTIYSSVDLFHAPLGLWIQDLAAPDPFYVMPVLLGVLMLVQSFFTPTPTAGDATQQKIMKYGMPLMFSVFMIALPAGLVLYILCNTVLTIFQNIVIRRRMA